MCVGVYQLVFLSPEALLSNETWRDTVPSPVYQENLVAVVIDEFYQHSCHVTLGGNVTNYVPLWNENLAHVTRRIFPSLPPPPFPRACAPRGKIRMACETTPSSAALTAVATLHLQPVHCDISVPSPAQSTLPFYWRLCTFIHSQWLLTVVQLEATRGDSRHVHVVRSLLNYSGLHYHGYVHHSLVLHSNTKIIYVYIMFT